MIRIFLACWLLACTSLAQAHEGPPYPVIVDLPMATFQFSAWADPDVGIGTFYAWTEPVEGGTLPTDTQMQILVQPSDGRIPEAAYPMHPARSADNQQQFIAKVPLETEETWRIHFVVQSEQGGGEAEAEVPVTPPGYGPLIDFPLFLFPFLAVGFLLVKAVIKSRSRAPVGEPEPIGRVRRGRVRPTDTSD